MVVEYIDPAKLIVSKSNARTHSIKQIRQLKYLIREFGFTNPILADEKREIIAGHGRHAAALELSLKGVPVITLKGLSQTKRRALALADNRVAMNSTWNPDVLAIEIKDLEKAGEFDLGQLGFTKQDLASLLGGDDAEETDLKYEASYSIIVNLASEKEQVKLLKRLNAEGYECKALIA